MKKTFIVLSIAASIVAAQNYQIGIAGGKTHVTHSGVLDKYNFVNFRLNKKIFENSYIRTEFEHSTRAVKEKSLKKALLNYEYDFNSNETFSPYYFVGAGYQWSDTNYKNALVADMGLGAKYKITDQLNLFAEVRALRDLRNIDTHYSGIVGFVFNFGNDQKEIQPQPTKKTIVPPKDTDQDGITDNLDKCPNTPKGVKVDKFGCPLDSDNDGVPNYLDKCPNTPKGVKVDKFGCPVTFNFDIQFDVNSAKIKPQYMKTIEKFAKFLKDNPAYKAEIIGYTDKTGNKIYNIILSQKRAKAVYEALIQAGVNKDRLSWAGLGDANPIAPNDTEENRAKNRRVVAKLFLQ